MLASESFLMRWHAVQTGGSEPCFSAYRDAEGRSSYQALLAALGDPGGEVLDLACGNGALLAAGGLAGVGVDLSAHELRAAQARLGPGARLVRANAARLPLMEARFAALTSHMALMLVRPLPEVLSECARVLRPGGRLVAVFSGGPCPGAYPAYLEVVRRRWAAGAPRPPALGDPRARDPAALGGLLAQAGFVRAEVRDLPVQRRAAPAALWGDLSGMYDVLAMGPEHAAALGREALAALEPHRGLDGKVRLGFGLRLVSAVRA